MNSEQTEYRNLEASNTGPRMFQIAPHFIALL